MMNRVIGTTIFNRCVARSRYSNWPDQETEYPAAIGIVFATTRLHFGHGRAQIAAAQVDVDPARQSRVLAAQHRRPVDQLNPGQVAQPRTSATLGDVRQVAQCFERIADLARKAQVEREALASDDDLADVVAADGGADERLHVVDGETVAGDGLAVDLDVDVAPARQPFGQRRRHAGHGLDGIGDAHGQFVDARQVRDRRP